VEIMRWHEPLTGSWRMMASPSFSKPSRARYGLTGGF
jgi:hypothetical protein